MVAAQTTTEGSTTTSPAAPPKRVAALIAVLGSLTAIAPLATDMYVPGFPEMGSSLHVSDSAVQLSMTAFLAGAVLGQILIGPLSDGLGRRKLLISGTAAFAALTLVCAVAPTIQVLVGARFLEGVAGSAGTVLARAVITDWFRGADIPRYFSMLSLVLGIGPVVAPVIGGAILSVSTWRAVFFVLTAVGVLLVLAVLAKVPESLPPARRNAGGLGSTFRAMGGLLGRRTFVGYVLTLGFSTAALFTYISGSSFVFEDIYDVSATQYSLIFAVNALGMLLAGGAFGVLARRLRMNTLLSLGVSTAAAGVVGQVALIATVGGSLAGTWCCLFVTLAGIGMVFPASMSLGQTLGRHAPGTGSALLGGTQFLLGALASPLVGLFGTSSATPMAVIMLGALACAALSLTLLARPWHGHGEFRGTAPSVAAA
jgi:DHA1 family bicyclomycin/chloramphenicol resistance-like MFS transporter